MKARTRTSDKSATEQPPAAKRTGTVAKSKPKQPPLPAAKSAQRPPGEGQAARESLTLRPAESQIIDELRLKLAKYGLLPNRSEIIRAGILVLSELPLLALVELVGRVPRLKPGRPT